MEIRRDWELALTVDHVLRGQGADPAQMRARRPALVETAAWALQEGLPLLEPAVLARRFQMEGLRHQRILLAGGASLAGELLAQHLAGAEEVVVMVCTIGGHLEEIASQVMQSDPLPGLALDGLGSAAVELLASEASRYYEGAAGEKSSWQTSIPLSPGMIGWPVDPGQRQIFAVLDGAQIGVRLTDSAMMSPSKSLTQVLGFGAKMDLQGRTCDYCNLKEVCRYQDHYH